MVSYSDCVTILMFCDSDCADIALMYLAILGGDS